jgi:hypothetical protein
MVQKQQSGLECKLYSLVRRGDPMKRILTLVLVSLTAMSMWSQSAVVTWEGAYHTSPPKKGEKLPPILNSRQLWGDYGREPYQRRAYEMAAANSSVLYQLPCKCHCERQGHTSLRSCFESTHGAGCDVCMKEALYASQRTRKGKTPAQIRDGINRSEHNKVELRDE